MLSVVHNYYYLLALLIIHSLRTSICVCKYLYMLSTTFNDRVGGAKDPAFSVDLTRSRAICHDPEILYIIRGTCCTSQGDRDSSFSYGRTMLLVQLLLHIDTSWPLSPVFYCSAHFFSATPHSFCVPHQFHIIHQLPHATPGT